MTQTQARVIYVQCTEPRHVGSGAQSGQVRETWKAADAAPPAPSFSEASTPGGSWARGPSVSVCPRPFSRLLLTRIQSRQAPRHLLPFLLLQGRPQVWKGREELTISPVEERGSGWGWGCCLWHPSDPIIQTLGWGFSSETEAPQPPSLCPGPPASSPLT